MFQAENLRDWRGKTVIDAEGHRLGHLTDIYVDTLSDEPFFLTVKTSGLATGYRLTFVPTTGATVKPDTVRVQYSKKKIHGAPSIATDGELDASDEPAIFAHYQLEYSRGPEGARRLARR